jgi:hypothetical protein
LALGLHCSEALRSGLNHHSLKRLLLISPYPAKIGGAKDSSAFFAEVVAAECISGFLP